MSSSVTHEDHGHFGHDENTSALKTRTPSGPFIKYVRTYAGERVTVTVTTCNMGS